MKTISIIAFMTLFSISGFMFVNPGIEVFPVGDAFHYLIAGMGFLFVSLGKRKQAPN